MCFGVCAMRSTGLTHILTFMWITSIYTIQHGAHKPKLNEIFNTPYINAKLYKYYKKIIWVRLIKYTVKRGL